MRTAADAGGRMLRHVARGLLFGGTAVLTGFGVFAGVPDPAAPAASWNVLDTAAVKSSAGLEAVPAMPGTAVIVSNPYGALTVSGGTLVGNTIYDLQPNAVIQLGTVAGSGGAALALHFQGFNIGPGNMLTLRSGAPLQVVVLYNADSSASAIAGVLQAEGGNGALPPYVYFANPNGLAA